MSQLTRRSSLRLVRRRLGEFPAVALLGARQSGKTTLARAIGGHYFDLERPADRTRLDLSWDKLVSGSKLVILDEAQEWPEVFPRLRGAIDERRRAMGRFLLLGSVSPALMTQVSESLAGRLALVELTPFHLGEVGADKADRLWRLGGYPDAGVLGRSTYPAWHESYLRLLASRDLPNWGLPSKPALTERLFRMTAAVHGGTLNASALGQSLGLSYHTVRSYLDHLEGAYLVRLLPPLEANLKKRLVKAPKLYWRDSGLLHALLGFANDGDLPSQPWVGASFEGWVIEQILAARQARGESLSAHFFRAHDGLEVDLVIDADGMRELIEIKLTSAPSPAHMTALAKVAALIGARRQVLISRTTETVIGKERWSLDLPAYLKAIGT
ncbi:MAG: ATP-binding protein [Deltaproteobacteria bacterium]|nr:ATP-binding protein [Deltaproteobacteria bacterium]